MQCIPQPDPDVAVTVMPGGDAIAFSTWEPGSISP